MGHNRAGDDARAKKRRRDRENARLESKNPKPAPEPKKAKPKEPKPGAEAGPKGEARPKPSVVTQAKELASAVGGLAKAVAAKVTGKGKEPAPEEKPPG